MIDIVKHEDMREARPAPNSSIQQKYVYKANHIHGFAANGLKGVLVFHDCF